MKLGSLAKDCTLLEMPCRLMVIWRGCRCSRLVLYTTLPKVLGRYDATPVIWNLVPQMLEVTSISLLLC